MRQNSWIEPDDPKARRKKTTWLCVPHQTTRRPSPLQTSAIAYNIQRGKERDQQKTRTWPKKRRSSFIIFISFFFIFTYLRLWWNGEGTKACITITRITLPFQSVERIEQIALSLIQTDLGCRGNAFSSSFHFSFSFPKSSNELISWRARNSFTLAPWAKCASHRKRERESFCVCRRERAIRSRQSFGHQPERRDVTYIYKSPSFPPLFYIANRLCLSIFAAFCTEKFFFFFQKEIK